MAESFSMNGGDGLNSYTKNSKLQGKGLDDAKALLSTSIHENLTIDSQSTLVLRIADLGCSVGPNTFTCVQTIIEAVQLKCENGRQLPEFQVFFNDHVANDFNMLFKGLPADRTYTVAGVPGSFYGRLFPKASMNLMHTSFSLHWLSRIPKHVTKEGAPVWNKGRITCVSSSEEVAADYAAQFKADMTSFFAARAEELADDGLLAILVPCRPESTLPSDSYIMYGFECLGHALVDMAKEGLVDEHLVDTFNLPLYIPSPSEVKQVVLDMKTLSIECFQDLKYPPVDLRTSAGARAVAATGRAVTEVLVCNHFGSRLDREELFERYVQKMEDFAKTPLFLKTKNIENLYMLVKRNAVLLPNNIA